MQLRLAYGAKISLVMRARDKAGFLLILPEHVFLLDRSYIPTLICVTYFRPVLRTL